MKRCDTAPQRPLRLVSRSIMCVMLSQHNLAHLIHLYRSIQKAHLLICLIVAYGRTAPGDLHLWIMYVRNSPLVTQLMRSRAHGRFGGRSPSKGITDLARCSGSRNRTRMPTSGMVKAPRLNLAETTHVQRIGIR